MLLHVNGIPTAPISVGMAQIVTAGNRARLSVILGSCIGIVLYSKRMRFASIAHVVLPDSNEENDNPGKFANTALPEMLKQLKSKNVSPKGLVAKLAGGANMFESSGNMQIGYRNHCAAVKLLGSCGIPIVGEHVGGNRGRRIVFDCDDGSVQVFSAGKLVCTL